MTKFGFSWKSGKTSYSGIGQKLSRSLIHTYHIYMYKFIFFWMLRAQIIRICNCEMKIWGCTPSSGAFSKWLPLKKCQKSKNRNFSIWTSNYQRYTKFTSRYMFLRMIIKNSWRIKRCFKIPDGRQFWPKKSFSLWNQIICLFQYCLNHAKNKEF